MNLFCPSSCAFCGTGIFAFSHLCISARGGVKKNFASKFARTSGIHVAEMTKCVGT